MRQDLTQGFVDKMVLDNSQPIQLAIIYLTYETLYLSDRDIVIDSQSYDGLIENWGDLTTVGAENAVSNTMQMNLTIWNGDVPPFSNYFLTDDPVDVRVEIYQTFLGLPFSDAALVGEFYVQDPIEHSEASKLLTIGLVSSNMRYVAQVGSVLTKAVYPDALSSDVNKSIDLIVGGAGEVQCLCCKKPPTAKMSGSILNNPVDIQTQDNLDDLNFPASGYVQIDEERMYYLERGSNYLKVTFRGADSTDAVSHADGSSIINCGTASYPVTVDYIVGKGPLSSSGIQDVKVSGQDPTVPYEVYPLEDPAMIRFQYPPTFADYSKSASSIVELFDSPVSAPDEPVNTAYRADWAYDEENQPLGAIIDSHDYETLSILQANAVKDEGRIIKIFLDVNHWASQSYSVDYMEVHVDGLGLVGVLNQPNAEDVINVGGSIDLTHTHEHALEPIYDSDGNRGHYHVPTDPVVSLHEPTDDDDDPLGHPHTANVIGTTVKLSGSPYDNSASVTSGASSGGIQGKSFNLTYSFNDNQVPIVTLRESVTIEWNALLGRVPGGESRNGSLDYIRITLQRWTGTQWVDQETRRIDDPSPEGSIEIPHNVSYDSGRANGYDRRIYVNGYIRADYYNSQDTTFKVVVSNPMWYFEAITDGVEHSLTDITPTQTSGDIGHTPAKDEDDVKPYYGNVDIVTILKDNASRSVLQSFDLTAELSDVDWTFLQNRKVWVKYIDNNEFYGSSEFLSVVITFINFRVEYSQREIKTTDDVTCRAVGSIEDRPDAVVQHLLHDIAGLPAESFGSVYRYDPLWIDTTIWNDEDPWVDRGKAVAEAPADALFEEASKWYAANTDYKIAGVISGSSSVKDAVANVTWQSRSKLVWQNGKAQLVVRLKTEDWVVEKEIDPPQLQLRSLVARRSSVTDVINKVDLYYTLDRLSENSDEQQYEDTVSVSDQDSIDKHGEKVDASKWMFDLVRNDKMAADVADYYVWYLGETLTYYEFATYLSNFNLEKSDYIRLTSNDFDGLSSTPVVIQELQRMFGAGKTNKIDILKMISEAIRIVRHYAVMTDTVSLIDTLSVVFGQDVDLEDVATLTDIIFPETEVGLTEDMTIEDSIASIFVVNQKIPEELTIEEVLTIDHEAVPEPDNISITDVLFVYDFLGFGTAPFGENYFGADVSINDGMSEVVSMSDVLTVTMN